MGPRIGGYRQELYREAFGIDHYYNDLLVHFGIAPNVEEIVSRHAAGLNIYADSEGTIESIENVDSAKKIPSVVYINVCAKPGDTARFASHGGQFIIDGILANEDKDTLEADVKKLRDLIKINISHS